MATTQEISQAWQTALTGLLGLSAEQLRAAKDQTIVEIEKGIKEVDTRMDAYKLEINTLIDSIRKDVQGAKSHLVEAKGVIAQETLAGKKEIKQEKQAIMDRLDACEKSIAKALEDFQTKNVAALEKRVAELASDLAGQARYMLLHKRIMNFAGEMTAALQKLSQPLAEAVTPAESMKK